MRDMYIKLKARIYVIYKACGTVGHFPPIYKIYIKIYYNFPVSIIKSLSHSPTTRYKQHKYEVYKVGQPSLDVPHVPYKGVIKSCDTIKRLSD